MKKESIIKSSISDALQTMENTRSVPGGLRQLVDAGLIGMCIAFLIAMLSMQQKDIDAHLHVTIIAFGIALPLIAWGYLQAALEPKRGIPGWYVLQAILVGSAVAESFGEIAVYTGVLFWLWHFSFSAFLATLLSSLFVLVIVPILSFIGLFVYVIINREELSAKYRASQIHYFRNVRSDRKK